jgi:hypothetical protein
MVLVQMVDSTLVIIQVVMVALTLVEAAAVALATLACMVVVVDLVLLWFVILLDNKYMKRVIVN